MTSCKEEHMLFCCVSQMNSHRRSAHQSRRRSRRCRHRPAADPRSPRDYTPSCLLDTLDQGVVLMTSQEENNKTCYHDAYQSSAI